MCQIILAVVKYTREAGVRGLERKLGAICRAVAVKVVEKQRSFVPKESAIDENEGKTAGTEGSLGSLVLSPIVLPPELPFVLDKEAVIDILGVSFS